ncbi:MAG: ABC transporter permease [Clostridia bacterium]|nr:ABC transporter permease [Clostridia bacterium]
MQNLSAHKAYLRKLKKRKTLVFGLQVGFIVFFLFLWEILVRLNVIDGFIFSSPLRIYRTFREISGDSLFTHAYVSTKETFWGFIIGTVLGTAVAIALWWSSLLKSVFEPYLVVLNSLPKIALGPIIIVWVGTGEASIITMAVLISVVITTLNMLSGFLQTDKNKILLMKTMNATRAQIFFKLVFPGNIPTLVSSLKINVGMSWVGTIMGEYLVSERGLGYLIVYGSQVFKLDLVMTCTVVLCVLAGVMYAAVALLERHIKRKRG